MHASDQQASLEGQIGQWRSYLNRRQAIHLVDVAELEDHLREQVSGLMESGLDADEGPRPVKWCMKPSAPTSSFLLSRP